MEWFEEQDAEYKEAVLPAAVKARVSVEAGVAMPWYKYLGSYGKPVSIEQFGLQGDGAQNMIDLGITAEHVVEAAKAPSRKSKPPSDDTGRDTTACAPPLSPINKIDPKRYQGEKQ